MPHIFIWDATNCSNKGQTAGILSTDIPLSNVALGTQFKTLLCGLVYIV